jgi:hypothetical protein
VKRQAALGRPSKGQKAKVMTVTFNKANGVTARANDGIRRSLERARPGKPLFHEPVQEKVHSRGKFFYGFFLSPVNQSAPPVVY